MDDFLPADLKPQRYITEKEVAALTGRAVQTLRNDRFLCKNIPYRKIGKSIRYSLQEVLEFMEAHRVDPEARCGQEVERD